MSRRASDPEKRELFGRLADELAIEALELEQVVKRQSKNSGSDHPDKIVILKGIPSGANAFLIAQARSIAGRSAMLGDPHLPHGPTPSSSARSRPGAVLPCARQTNSLLATKISLLDVGAGRFTVGICFANLRPCRSLGGGVAALRPARSL